MTPQQPKDVNRHQPPAVSDARPVAYENEMYRLTQLKAYELAQADDFKQPPQDYWLLAEKEMYLGY